MMINAAWGLGAPVVDGVSTPDVIRMDRASGRVLEYIVAEKRREFHRLHEQEYGHAFRDPIEIVNLRVTAYGKRARVERIPAVANGGDALLGEGESVFGGVSHAARYYDRAHLPAGEVVAGPAVIFQRDTTTVVPPGWKAHADESGCLVLRR